MTTVVTNKQLTGGAAETLPLKGGPDFVSVQIGFSGRNTGTVTVSARGVGADNFDTVTGGAVNLATQGTLVIAGFSIADLKFTDGGTGAYTVNVIQRT